MSEDWKSRIDNWQNHEEEKKHSNLVQKEKAEQREHERRVAEHQSRFKCNVCGKPSSGPNAIISRSGGEYGIPLSEAIAGYRYDEPTGLEKCTVCGNWTCLEHLYKRICKNCAQKL
jgi:rubredoxin